MLFDRAGRASWAVAVLPHQFKSLEFSALMPTENAMGFALGALVTAPIALFARKIGHNLGLLDVPGGRKLHRGITPTVGGLAIGLVALANLLVALFLDPARLGVPEAALTACAIGICMLGILDDLVSLPAVLRLFLSAAIVAPLVYGSPSFRLSHVGFDAALIMDLGPVVGLLLTVLCVVTLINAVNMADGKNGIVIGLALFWTFALLGRAGPAMDALLAVLGGALGMLFLFNLAGKLFLGDGGSYMIAVLYGFAAITVHNRAPANMVVGEAILLFAVPVLDTLRLIVWRLARGRSPFTGDRDHLHHHLFDRYGWPKGLVAYMALAIVPYLGFKAGGGAGLWLIVSVAGYLALMSTTSVVQPPAGGTRRP